MRNLVAAFFLAPLFLTAAISTPAAAWGPPGHKIVCYMAEELLSKSKQKKLNALVKTFEHEGMRFDYFSTGCTFADTARRMADDKVKGWEQFGEFKKWHFLNLKRDDFTVDRGDCHPKQGCVLLGIERDTKALKNGTNKEKAMALMFLGHWVGDLHQPLHISYADDWGGNKIDHVAGFYKDIRRKKLHSVWDGGILKKAGGSPDWRAYAHKLLAEIREDAPAPTGGPTDWAQESFDITTAPETLYCKKKNGKCNTMGPNRTLTEAYQDAHATTMDQRLKLAAERLAAILEDAL